MVKIRIIEILIITLQSLFQYHMRDFGVNFYRPFRKEICHGIITQKVNQQYSYKKRRDCQENNGKFSPADYHIQNCLIEIHPQNRISRFSEHIQHQRQRIVPFPVPKMRLQQKAKIFDVRQKIFPLHFMYLVSYEYSQSETYL